MNKESMNEKLSFINFNTNKLVVSTQRTELGTPIGIVEFGDST